MSRNKQEGRYYGWAKGRHVRTREHGRVDSWRAFRLIAQRMAMAWAKRVMAARAKQQRGKA